MASPRPTWLQRLLIVPPLLIGVALLGLAISGRESPGRLPAEETVRPVRVVTATPTPFVPRALGYGQVRPVTTWEAVAEVAGRITWRHPDLQNGRLIDAGAVILRIDRAHPELALARAQANLAGAQAQRRELEVRGSNLERSVEIQRRTVELAGEELDRRRSLLERGSIPRSQVDEAETALLAQRQALQELENQRALLPAQAQLLEATAALHRAQIDEAELDLARTEIRLPLDARIGEVRVERDQFVGVGQVLVAADGIERAEIPAQFALDHLIDLIPAAPDLVSLATLDTGEIARLPERFGFTATVRLRIGDRTVEWEGRVDRLAGAIDPATRTAGVVVTVEEPFRQARPGERPPLTRNMFVEVEVAGPAQPDRLVVPRGAVHRDEERRRFLWLADADDRLEARPVEVVSTQGDLAVVGTGLEVGERVVVSDLDVAVAGMKLAPHRDEGLEARLRAEAAAEAPVR